MTKIPHTQFYDSTLLNEVRQNGFKNGAEWMRSKVIEILLDHPDNDEMYLDYIDYINDIVFEGNSDERT